MITIKLFSIVSFYILSFTCQHEHVAVVAAATDIVTGKPHTTVQVLTETNFDEALNDPANGLWLLKFYGMYKYLYVLLVMSNDFAIF